MKLLSTLVFAALPLALTAQPAPTYATLREGETLAGFRAAAVYLDGSDRAIGARFVHGKTGFTLDLLEIQSVPQTFLWVNTFPTSDMGEPHTQEHLLLGKGNKGRSVATREPMVLVRSSAFTQQWRTCYHFYTSAGAEVFYDHLQAALDALLHPDYTDEEVRREVRNFGVSAGPGGQLRLEEKGTVYNEMVTSMDGAQWRVWSAIKRAVYGADHPLAFNSGGTPEALRVLQPDDIRKFHREHYFLANMGMVTALPRDQALPAALARFGAMLDRLEPQPVRRRLYTEADLPAPRPAPAGSIQRVPYPFRNDQQPGSVVLVWPAERNLDPVEKFLCERFLANLASDPSTNLYKRFIDSRTRELNLGAQGVFASLNEDRGMFVNLSFSNVPVAGMTDEALSELRARVLAELDRVANWADGAPELVEFHARLRSRIVAARRGAMRFVNAPPGFGFRNTNSAWMEHLHELNRAPGFKKSLVQKDELAAAEALLAGDRNIWRERLTAWKLRGVTPVILAAQPSPELLQQQEREREERVAAEVRRLTAYYAATDPQEALRRYEADYAKGTAEIETATKAAKPQAFLAHPPLTLDEQLDYKVAKLAGDVPLVTSTFDSMTNASIGLALRLDGVPEDQLLYLAMLPGLLRSVGVIENGTPVSFEQMTGRLRNEILSLTVTFRSNLRTGRVELVVRGSGNDAAETARAIDWMKLVLTSPDWRMENLPRLRDLADQTFTAAHNTMQGREESWVNDPAAAYRRQENPLWLSTESFLARAHHIFRLRWMLKDSGDADTRTAVSAFLRELGALRGSREELKTQLAALRGGTHASVAPLSAGARAIAADAAKDLEFVLPDIPDSSLAADWAYLCEQMRRDFETGPAKTLQALDAVRRSLLKTGGARMFAVGSSSVQPALAQPIAALVGTLERAPFTAASYRATRRIDERLRGRDAGAVSPVFVGLLHPNSQGGVFLHSAPGASYRDTSRDALLDYLASNLYGGSGAHGIFMKTWAAGLAYSNGIRISLGAGQLGYYAERTPELPVTLQFVIDEIERAQPDPALLDYAIAGAFSASRAAETYESRAEAIADDLADGASPEVVAAFRRAILDLRRDPKLGDELFARMKGVYARVLPGMKGRAKNTPGSVYLVIGPEKQFAAYEAYLKKTEGADATLHRLHPRDFWIVGSANGATPAASQ